MKNHPELLLPPSPLERRLEITASLLVAVHFLLATYYYPLLPERIPTHFNLAGTVDQMSNKTAIFQLPVIALVLCTVLALLAKFPHKLTYRQPITPENAAVEYRQVRRILWIVNVLDGIFLLLLSWTTIRAANGSGSLSDAVWVVVALLVIAPWLVLGKRR